MRCMWSVLGTGVPEPIHLPAGGLCRLAMPCDCHCVCVQVAVWRCHPNQRLVVFQEISCTEGGGGLTGVWGPRNHVSCQTSPLSRWPIVQLSKRRGEPKASWPRVWTWEPATTFAGRKAQLGKGFLSLKIQIKRCSWKTISFSILK